MSDAISDTSTAGGSTKRRLRSVKSVDGPEIADMVQGAPPVTSGHTAGDWVREQHIAHGFADTTDDRPTEPGGSEPPAGGKKAMSYSGSLSTTFAGQSGVWKAPKNIMELAAQANVLATQLLNDEVSIPKARAYGTIARAVAGLLKAELDRRRWVGQDVELPNDEVHE